MSPTKHKQKHHNHSHNRSSTSSTASPAAFSGEEWREEAINGGSLKHVDLHTGSNGWASPPGDLFSLRGPNYFTKKAKIPAGEWLLNPAGVDWLRSNAKLDHVLARPDNRVMNALRSSQNCEKSSKTFIVAVNLQVPGRDHYSAVFYFSSKIDEPINSNSLLHQFINGSDAFRSSRFKIVNKIVKGPWIVKTALGYCYRNFAAGLGVCDSGDSGHGVSGGGTKGGRVAGTIVWCGEDLSNGDEFGYVCR
ncbi:UNVERIFIED_CONTAM: hypothetical protein Slati_4356500 [Sesamum latifolium]|uniref:Protein ENHANCED DISEASE RESISTANCE 2 C-terminal domain-containing protein n=1 Tax=Sesamum latifolium TaxID=2727402 RepID=A0AAW2SQ40_9LAMI